MATLLLASPHFDDELPTFLSRLTNMLPGMPVLGGVTQVGLGDAQQPGVLFLGSHAFDSGMVGVIMEGPVALTSCRLPHAGQGQHATQNDRALLVYGPLRQMPRASMPVHGAHFGTRIVGRECQDRGTVLGVLSKCNNH